MQSLTGKITGDSLTAAEWNQLPSEVQNVITGLGQTLTSGDLNQLGKSIAGYVANGDFYTDSGAADAYVLGVIGSKQTPTAYTDGFSAVFRAGNANTGASTVNVAGLGVKSIKTIAGADPAAGDIAAGDLIEMRYDLANGWFDFISLQAAVSTGDPDIQSITASVAANALTVGMAAGTLSFRDATLTVGAPNERTIASALSLIVPSGATLGTIAATQSRQILLAIDNAGTVELAIVNLAGGVNLDETTLVSTVAIDATADSDNVIYSNTARTNVPFRVVGFVESTQAVAGTWATAPSTIQGAGGNALTAMNSLGYGQKWQDVTSSRALGTTYYNTTGKPLYISVTGSASIAATELSVFVDGEQLHGGYAGTTLFSIASIQVIVWPGSSYSASLTGSLTRWVEGV